MISIIIPTANEAQYLSRTLTAISEAGQSVPHEIVVVDAGSRDETAEIATAQGARLLLSATRQRAVQMNFGAAHARGEFLLFLHGDTALPTVALSEIERVLLNQRVTGGAFARRYDSPSRILRMTCALAYLRSRMSGWFLGDQAIFVRADVFRKMSGFRSFDLFEDLDFSRRLRATGKTVVLRPAVISAARRFEQKGPCRTTWNDFRLTLRYLRGVSPNALDDRCVGDPTAPSLYEGT